MEICKKKGRFYPDILFPHIYEITPAFLESQQVKGLILDLDNTIAPYEEAEPTPKMRAWFDAMKQAGIKMAFVSNNKGDRVKIFNRTLGLPLFAGAKKPFTKGMRQALTALHLSPGETAGLGDQIFTDILGANLAGMPSILVTPMDYDEPVQIRFKRVLEKPILWCYGKIRKEGGGR